MPLPTSSSDAGSGVGFGVELRAEHSVAIRTGYVESHLLMTMP